MKKIVVIGGGTGTHTVLSGLKKLDVDITAIVTVADSGGSTGRLRDEFGYLPVGDLRMALVALSDVDSDNNILRELFLYRFQKGNGLLGHNFGNLLITALTEMLGSEERAYEYASKILRVKGQVIPITDKNITLVAEYDGGSVLIGESLIDEPSEFHDGTARIRKLSVQPEARISQKAEKAILHADVILLGPGDLYTSTLANFVVDGASEAIRNSSAIKILTVNLINKFGQTPEFTATSYVEEIANYLDAYPDYVVVNSAPLPKDILIKYEKEHGYPVIDDLISSNKYKIVRKDLLAEEEIKRESGDTLKRSLIRHDSEKLAKVISDLVDLD